MLDHLAQYKILERIGAGGMGEVYRARDTRLGRTVAIKVLPAAVAGDHERRDRFLREAQAAAALSHPNIAALFEIGDDQDHLFLVFEFVPGDSLRAVIAGRPLNPRRALHLAAQVADALADAHAAGIVHRDIKPDNIVVTPKGNAKVLDFGLAKWTAGGAARDEAATLVETAAGSRFGTVAYMSPEQALGEPVDHRTDIFSFGIVLYEMLTGALPFRGATPTAMTLQIVQSEAAAPSTVNASVPRDLDAIVARALAKKPDDRYDSAAMIAADLRSVDAALAARAETTERAALNVPVVPQRRGFRPWMALALVVASLAGIGWSQREWIGRTWRRSIAAAPSPIIAVIPLDLADVDQAQRYFADGLTEDLITRLGQTPGLRVIGRSATRDYRGRSPRDLARELGAGVVLTGAVRPAGETVRISLELIDPADSTDLWTGQYTREVKDIFAVQSQVADDVARALRLKLTPTAARERTASRLVDQRAYESYLRGRQAAAQRDLGSAKRFFDDATRLDDGLAEAHAGMAEALHLEAVGLGQADDPSRRARLKRSADRAYELDPDLPQANLAAGLAADRLADALGFLKKAVTVDPTFSEGFHEIGDQILDVDPARAIAFYRRALALDPRMEINHADITGALSALGRFDEAERELDSVPGNQDRAQWKAVLRAAIALDRQDYDKAAAAFESGPLAGLPVFALSDVNALRMAGRADAAYQQARRLVQKNPSYCEAIAALAGLRHERGERAAARQMVASALRAAETPDVGPAALRCAGLSAAAIGDASAAAAVLQRIAADERQLRAWALEITGTTGSKLFRRNMFPWSHVSDAPPIVEARHALERAYATAREQIAASLGPITP